jgi:hypothetical protein
MKIRWMLLVTLASFAFVAPDFTSGLTIPAHEQFYLGGGQKNAFSATAKNKGKVPVSILTQAPGEDPVLVVVLKPGEKATAKAAAKNAILLRNETDQEAELFVTGPGKPESLNMSYKKEGEYKK